ncbi:ThiF family adenylyltransferase [Shewanella algae]|uniref:ThiF family adenylyltransferase n=1 Tax=Shewanella algae TaxID=38313 RepID=UPI001AAC9284|nr:ThiF family adenylyltransferase [Shewanella algae]MBO2683071.1 ThiF family adenylyltransferase [Shewanella algae]
MTPEELNKVVQQIGLPFIIEQSRTGDRTHQFTLQGKSRVWEVELWFCETFPFRLPQAKLLDQALIGKLPHVNILGTICVEESDSVLIDYAKPALVISSFLADVLRLLERVSLKIYRSELHDELEGYYSSIPAVNSFYFAGTESEKVTLKVIQRQRILGYSYAIPIMLSGDGKQPPIEFSNTAKLGQLQSINIPHFPLQQAIIPPENASAITSDYVTQLLAVVDEHALCVLRKTLKGRDYGRQFFVLFSMPRDGKERSQLLLHFKANAYLQHPLLKLCPDWKIDTYSVRRHNKEYLLERGGTDASLLQKKVAVIGCGSVGGEVAAMLAKSGIGELILIDPDKLEADNIYRHRLGGAYLNFMPSRHDRKVRLINKVHALASEIQKNLPFVKVTPIASSAENINTIRAIKNVDTVIVAVGNPSLSLLLNKQLLKFGVKHAIFCWNEASGYGGHSVSLELEKVCYECLFSDENGFTAENILSLVKPGQAISKNLTGCAGVFTPFSYLDSSRTAAIATQQTIDALLGHNSLSIAHSWKGKNSHGLQVTKRFNQMPIQDELVLVKQAGCRGCHAE